MKRRKGAAGTKPKLVTRSKSPPKRVNSQGPPKQMWRVQTRIQALNENLKLKNLKITELNRLLKSLSENSLK